MLLCAVDLNAPGDPPMRLQLRPLTGADELGLSGTGQGPAMDLLARLSGVDVAALTISQIDRGLAGIHSMLYGDSADCRASCIHCGESFGFTLSLAQVIAAQDAERPGPADADGTWTLPGGARVRAPRPADVAGDPQAVATAITVAGPVDVEAIGAFLETAAPLLTFDIQADCPCCSASADLRFDLASYLTRRLALERPLLIREAHLIASGYRWSHSEITGLSRDDRRAFAGVIEAERSRLARRSG